MIDVPRETRARLDRLVEAVLDESKHQNLISAATVSQIQPRHIVDSLQLLPLLGPGTLLDIGSGGGFPGMVLACCRPDQVSILVEPRAKRADFLRRLAAHLDLALVEVSQSRVETVDMPPVSTITARAVAPLDRLFAMAQHLADENTIWVLPKGRTVESELDAVRRTWQGDFDLIASQTDPNAAIVVARGIRRRR